VGTTSDLPGLFWVTVAGLLFGSQFVFSKYCPGFRPGAYNITMAIGILAGSAAAPLFLGSGGIGPLMAGVAFIGGMTWVAGNYLLILAVARAGMARSFIAINFSAVLSFIGGILFLGELPGLSPPGLLALAGAVGLVLLGSFLVTTTTKNDGANVADGGLARKGLLAAFVATVFFSIYNVIIAFIINSAGMPAGTTFTAISPGIVTGAILLALLFGGGELREWRGAPRKWHLLALGQGLVWAVAMACIMMGWRGTGIALGTPVQVGTQTLISSLWGIAAFGELRGHKDRRSVYAKFAAGAALTVAGIMAMAFF